LMEPNLIRINPAQTINPMRIKTGKRTIYFNTIGVCQTKDFMDPLTRRGSKEEYSLLVKVSKTLVSLGASVDLH
jgi:hypothetical protein